jgi:hypothetical protein
MGSPNLAKEPNHHKRYHHPVVVNQVVQPQSIPFNMALNFCGANHCRLHAHAIFQRCSRISRRSRFLATYSIFPSRDVHSAKEGAQMEHTVDLFTASEPGLLDNISCCCCWIHSWSYIRSKNIQALQNNLLICERHEVQK